MSSSDAQKSEVHDTTDDASTAPTRATGGPSGAGSMTGGTSARRKGAPEPDRSQFPPASNYERGAAEADRRPVDEGATPADVTMIGGVPGASDATSGGGSGAGIPDADSGLRNAAPPPGEVAEDRSKLFPESDAAAQSKDEAFPPGVKVKRDDSDVGGPIDIETPT